MLKKIIPINNIYLINNEIIIIVDNTLLTNILLFLKNNENCRFDFLIDICGVDYPEKKKRFEVVYLLLSITYNQRIHVKTNISEIDYLHSIHNIFKNAN